MIQAVDYSYSDYDYQPEEGRSLGAEDEYYEDSAPARAYNFQFQGEEQSRQEEQDEDGLVTGSYSYLGADGVQHTVNYRAGAGIGFEIIDPSVEQMFADFGAKVDDPLPVAAVRDAAPAVVVEAAVAPDSLYGAPAAAPDTLYGAPAEELPTYSEELPSYVELPRDESSSEEVEATTTGMMMDPSYYFQYKSADSERTEDADSNGAVVGSYSYLSPGGQEIVVRYKAGADTGFVIENQEELNSALLRAASEPFEAAEEVVEQASEPREHVFTLEGDDEDVLPTPLSGSPAPLESLYSAPPPAPVAQPTSLYGAPALDNLPSYEEPEVAAAPATMMMMDPSYNFAYAGDAGNREEAADSQGVVTGSYSYLSPEGNEILVRYTAGADTGFVIENSDELAASVRDATNAGAEAATARAVLVAEPLPLASTSSASDSVVISVPDSLYGAPPPAESLPSYQEEIVPPDTLYGAPA